ncbi:hypothetical protein ACQ4PT_054961 [Festuca glaucescens]
MSNSGGGGGFGPARGNGPGRGRGDRGGGHNGPGRGGGYNGPASGASFNGPSAFNTGRGGGYNNRFFGGDNGRPGNFVAGESSGTADDRDNGQGQPFPADFGSEFGHFNRGSNFNNYHRNGGNQQYRPRNYGNNNFNSNNQNGYNGGRSNFNQYRNSGGGSIDPVIQNGASLAGINPDLLKEAMQGVVAALAAAAQRGGAEGIPTSALAVAAPTVGQSVAPIVQQSQTLVPGPQQAQPMQLDSATLPKPDAPNPAKKAKKADKNPCFRCKQPGHQIDTCTAPACDICESPNHISCACPLLQAPKPSVTMYGYAIEHLMFFELPTGGTYKPKVDNVKLVKVTVEGDPMSIPEIAECLRRIVPVENFQWEIYNFQNNVFRVKFPNKSEAQRMKTFRTYPVPDRASDLIFEDCDGMDNNGDNNGGGDNNGSNGDNRDGANDMDIEKAMNNEQQGNGNSQKGNVKNVNNGKGVVGHQVQHQFEAPIPFGSLNTDLLSKEGTPFQADPAPGSVKIRPASTSGSERPGAADSFALPLGSQSPASATAVAAASSPGEASPPTRRVRSSLSPTCHQVLSATERAVTPVGCMAPAVKLGMATVSPSCTPEKILPVPPALSHVTPMVVGPGRDRGHLRMEEQHGSPCWCLRIICGHSIDGLLCCFEEKYRYKHCC